MLYGGAAGGGKSFTLLMAALEWADVYPVHSLLIRRSFADLKLPEALIPVAQDWLGDTDARWNDNDHEWTFPTGATLTFGYMEAEKDKFRYQGAAVHLIGFDELTQFTQTQYRYVFSRQRRKVGSQVPIRTIATSNPGGEGHDWVYERFLTEAGHHPLEGECPICKKECGGRVFIPAKLEDNPHLDRAEYERSLSQLDPLTYLQLRHGDWTVRPSGGWFNRGNFPVVDEAPAIRHAVRYWDMAASEVKPGQDPDWTVGLLLGEGIDGLLYVLDVVRFRRAPADTEKVMKVTARGDSTLPLTIWLEQEPGASGVIAADHLIRNVLNNYAAFAEKKEQNKKARARPVAAQVARKAIRLVRAPWNGAFLDELEGFPLTGHDDQVDGLSGAYAKLREGGLLVAAAEAPEQAPAGTSLWDGYDLGDEDEEADVLAGA